MSEHQPAPEGSGSAPRRRGAGRPDAGPAVLTPPTGLPAIPVPRENPTGPLPVQQPAAVRSPVARPAGPPAPPRARRDVGTTLVCRCGHGADQHEHHRSGRDCGTCGPAVCGRFRAKGGLLARLRRALTS